MYYQKNTTMNKVTELIARMNRDWKTRVVDNTSAFNESVNNVLKPKRKSIVFRTAWVYVKGWGMTLSEALKKSWSEVLA